MAEETAENKPAEDTNAQAAPKDATPPPAGDAVAAPPPADQVDAKEPELTEVQAAKTGGGAGQIDILLETAMPVTARLGQAEMEVRDLLELGVGSVVRLNRRVGEPVDLMLRGIRFATGHVVVVGDQLGIRIKEILSANVSDESQAEG